MLHQVKVEIINLSIFFLAGASFDNTKINKVKIAFKLETLSIYLRQQNVSLIGYSDARTVSTVASWVSPSELLTGWINVMVCVF